MDDQPRRRIDIPQVLRNLRRVIERTPDDRNLAPMLVRQIHRNPNPMDRRREAGEEQLLARLRKDVVQPRNHGLFTRRKARPVHIRRVLQQHQHALLAQVGKRLQVERMAVRRR
jgi:hypothetical protein